MLSAISVGIALCLAIDYPNADREAGRDPRATADAAGAEFDIFEEKWAGKYASIAPPWRRAWAEMVPFFAFDPTIRKSIKTRGSFPTDDAAPD